MTLPERKATAMILFTDGIDYRCREPKVPTVAKLIHSKSTLKAKMQPLHVDYVVIGTQYGYIHTSGGDVRTWKSYSGARRAARAYVPL